LGRAKISINGDRLAAAFAKLAFFSVGLRLLEAGFARRSFNANGIEQVAGQPIII
jgi:hypothetical protein